MKNPPELLILSRPYGRFLGFARPIANQTRPAPHPQAEGGVSGVLEVGHGGLEGRQLRAQGLALRRADLFLPQPSRGDARVRLLQNYKNNKKITKIIYHVINYYQSNLSK